MAVSTDTRRRWALIVGLRGLLMVLAGIYAVIFPGMALAALVIVGGVLLIIDGALGLWSLTFGGARTGNYWFDVVRNALTLILGVLILISPLVATLLTAIFLVYLFAFQAIVVGVMEIWVIVRERDSYARIWPVLLSGILYVILGIVLLLVPVIAAEVLVMIGGILAVLFGAGLLAMAWRLHQATKSTPA